jgi:hypothetical protein
MMDPFPLAYLQGRADYRTALPQISYLHLLLFRANPHLTLRARQATAAYVTPRRFARPRFTLASPILTGLYYTLSTASPLLTNLA